MGSGIDLLKAYKGLPLFLERSTRKVFGYVEVVIKSNKDMRELAYLCSKHIYRNFLETFRSFLISNSSN